MKAAGVEAIVESLRSVSMPTIVFAVQGGSFSEGMDYAGETVIGAFVVGIGEELSLIVLDPSYRTAIGFVAILVVLSFRPRGILGERAY